VIISSTLSLWNFQRVRERSWKLLRKEIRLKALFLLMMANTLVQCIMKTTTRIAHLASRVAMIPLSSKSILRSSDHPTFNSVLMESTLLLNQCKIMEISSALMLKPDLPWISCRPISTPVMIPCQPSHCIETISTRKNLKKSNLTKNSRKILELIISSLVM